MKKLTASTIELYRVAISGLLIVFSARILLGISEAYLVSLAISMVALGFLLARSVTKHFGHNHKHAGDSAIDAIPVIVLIFANIFHPAIDGFSLAQTFKFAGVLPGGLFILSIILHEIIRQSALIEALSISKINWKWIVGTATLGIFIGIGSSFFGKGLFDRYEGIADMATLFSYAFIVGEFHFLKSNHKNKYTLAVLIAGLVFGILILKLTNAH